MPPDRGRASKACVACRKIKTRCYEPESYLKGCLRCERLGQPCSLTVDAEPRDLDDQAHFVPDKTLQDERISRLEETVAALVERLDHQDAQRGVPLLQVPRNELTPSTGIQNHPIDVTTTPTAAPVFLIRDAASEIGVNQPNSPEIHSARSRPRSDIISKGLVTLQEATALLQLFQEHYGRWVCFEPMATPEALQAEVLDSPLLLCACCLIAVRHTTRDSASKLAPHLFDEAKGLLSAGLLVVPQTVEFFQAALILSMWSTTIGQIPMSIDGWIVSGYALQQALAASDVFGSNVMKKLDLDRMCIYNHLCLVHLHYCVGTRRRSILDCGQIDKCRDILGSDHATNFETRMVAETNLYWIIYESCSAASVDLPKTQKALQDWKNEWTFLFDQPRSQFVQMGFHFAQLLVYDQSLKSRSAAVRESLLSEMVNNSAAIINLAMGTSDSRTKHLSDHIYHVITFAAVTLCRLLNMYEQQLSGSQNIPELDTLVLSLVTWLHTIGLPCHAAHTLGDVVSAFHSKLRPNSHPSPYAIPGWSAEEDLAAYFPELLGMESYDFENTNLLPNWDPYIQGPAT